MPTRRMTEKQLDRAYFSGMITAEQHKDGLRRIADARHRKAVSQMRSRRSMSSSKWS